jgi:heat shock protein HtpX
MDNLFSTHPATENRIAALRQLATEMGGHDGFGVRHPHAVQHNAQRPTGPWGGNRRASGPWG